MLSGALTRASVQKGKKALACHERFVRTLFDDVQLVGSESSTLLMFGALVSGDVSGRLVVCLAGEDLILRRRLHV